MPIYEFHCQKCGADSELLIRSRRWEGTPCPKCGSTKFCKKLSVFASPPPAVDPLRAVLLHRQPWFLRPLRHRPAPFPLSAPSNIKSANAEAARGDPSARAAITYYNPMEEREADKAPLQMALIRRIFRYTRPYAAKRNWLFILTFTRGLQLPALAWLIGRTINGPISGRDLPKSTGMPPAISPSPCSRWSTFHFRQRFALELGEAVVHDMRTDLFAKLMTMPMSFFNQTKFGRIISRLTSDIDSVRAGVQDVAFVLVVQGFRWRRRRR